MTTALVSGGGAGFLGSHLCDHLLARGDRVLCVDNLDTGSLSNIAHLRDERFTFVNHDLTGPLFLDEAVDLVFHLAGPASPIDYQRLPLHTLKVGSYGTHNMLGLAKFKRARFLLASTSEVYGDPQVHPQPETYWGHVNPIRKTVLVRMDWNSCYRRQHRQLKGLLSRRLRRIRDSNPCYRRTPVASRTPLTDA